MSTADPCLSVSIHESGADGRTPLPDTADAAENVRSDSRTDAPTTVSGVGSPSSVLARAATNSRHSAEGRSPTAVVPATAASSNTSASRSVSGGGSAPDRRRV